MPGLANGDSSVIVTDTLLLFKLVLAGGLALWLTVGFFNNIMAFAAGVAAIGRLMGMQMFDQPPAIQSPLLSRRVNAPALHLAVYSFITLIEGVAAVLFWYAVFGLSAALFAGADVNEAVSRANLALSVLAFMSFVMLLGGGWFAYHIRQEGLQLTHFTLIGLSILGVIVMNLPAA